MSDQAPLWLAVSLYALLKVNPETGRADLRAGELRQAVAPEASAALVSQAIRRAVRAGWLHADSSAWSLRPIMAKVAGHGA